MFETASFLEQQLVRLKHNQGRMLVMRYAVSLVVHQQWPINGFIPGVRLEIARQPSSRRRINLAAHRSSLDRRKA